MLFGARRAASTIARLRSMVRPRAAWRAVHYYVRRIQRFPGSPHRLALGFAWGAALSMTPFVGIHGIAAVALAWVTRGSWVTALIGTVVGNPWTFPLIWVATFQIGGALYPGAAPAVFSPTAIGNEILLVVVTVTRFAVAWDPGAAAESLRSVRFIPVMALGSLPLGGAVFLAGYFGLRAVIVRYRAIREARRAAADAARAAGAPGGGGA